MFRKRDPIDVSPRTHTLIDLDGHISCGCGSLHRPMINLHRLRDLLEVRTTTTKTQCLTNLEVSGKLYDADLWRRKVVNNRPNESFRLDAG